MSVEWRLRDGEEVLLLVDEGRGGVLAHARAEEELLKSFLAASGRGDIWRAWAAWQPADDERRDADVWGELVLSRADGGEVRTIAPELYWDGIYRWFRSRGVDVGP
jgi:hypothetical protein